MMRLTLASVRGHLMRFLLTAGAVMLGVSFVAGTFVLSDSIDSTLKSLFTQALKGVDVQVRGAAASRSVEGGTARAAVPIDLEDRLAAVDGVRRVAPDVQGSALVAGADGLPVRNGGAPGLGFAYRSDDPAFTLIDGRAPSGPQQAVLETRTLQSSGLSIGDTTRAVIGSDVREVTITGEVEFGAMFGATALLVDEDTARAAWASDGNVPAITVTADPAVSQEELARRIDAVLPSDAETVTGATLDAEAQSDLKQGLGFFTTFLLVFAAVALFVGSFIIVNTFSMLIAQRTRELALLRAVGASRGQVMRMVLGEAAAIGVLGSVLGIGLGLLIVIGAKAAIRTGFGAEIGSGLPVGVDTVAWSVLVGTAVTLIAALIPARRAARIAPVAAMRDDMPIAPRGLRLRGLLGLAMVAAGIALLAITVSREDVTWPLVGLGAALAVLGVIVASPLAARPVVRVVAWPFVATGGAVGRLARENALRVPRRTASTASALMIGLALISGLSLLAQSVKASIADIVAKEVTADYVLNAGNGALVPPAVQERVAGLEAVAAAAGVAGVPLRIDDADTFATAADPGAFDALLTLRMVSGAPAALGSGRLLVSQTFAEENSVVDGSDVTAVIGGTAGRELTVGGIYEDSQLMGEAIIGRALYEEATPVAERGDFVVLVDAATGTEPAALRAELVGVVAPYLTVSVDDGEEYVDSATGQIDLLLNLLYALLLFSVVVAVLGIVNTLALSVIERTREIGLLRAVGLGRRQLAGMITIESVATAVFGAVLGTVLGLGLGLALQRGLRSQGLDVLAIPWTTIGVVLVAAALVGVVAAVLPAVRAVRLNVLQAIATE